MVAYTDNLCLSILGQVPRNALGAHIHNWSLEPFGLDSNQVSHTTYVVCFNFRQHICIYAVYDDNIARKIDTTFLNEFFLTIFTRFSIGEQSIKSKHDKQTITKYTHCTVNTYRMDQTYNPLVRITT